MGSPCCLTQLEELWTLFPFLCGPGKLFQPETSAEFYRDRDAALAAAEPRRYEALLPLGGPKLSRLFQMDVGFGLLGDAGGTGRSCEAC